MTKQKPKVEKECAWCSWKFTTQRKNKVTCSKKCSDQLYETKRVRKSPTTTNLICKQCGCHFKSISYNKVYCSDRCKHLKRNQREVENNETKKKQLIMKVGFALVNSINKHRSCLNCGRDYVYRTHVGTTVLYCSQDCRVNGERIKRRSYRRISKDKRITRNGKADYSINLEELSKRDKGVCYLCHKETSFDDYIETKEGWFIAGNDYPSIDHVIPIAKGGLHNWGNVKLAHRLCNSKKSDTI